MKDTLQDTVESLLSDIESMRCRCPDDLRDVGDRDDELHWFGGFGCGHFDMDAATWKIEWPNLSIMAEKLQRLLDLETIDKIPLDQPMNDEETAALDREVERGDLRDEGRSGGYGESYAERNR